MISIFVVRGVRIPHRDLPCHIHVPLQNICHHDGLYRNLYHHDLHIHIVFLLELQGYQRRAQRQKEQPKEQPKPAPTKRQREPEPADDVSNPVFDDDPHPVAKKAKTGKRS